MFVWTRRVSTSLFFFFQAEDGIRDPLVTGVQTCALPICSASRTKSRSNHQRRRLRWRARLGSGRAAQNRGGDRLVARGGERSEERRVGKECRSRWSA